MKFKIFASAALLFISYSTQSNATNACQEIFLDSEIANFRKLEDFQARMARQATEEISRETNIQLQRQDIATKDKVDIVLNSLLRGIYIDQKNISPELDKEVVKLIQSMKTEDLGFGLIYTHFNSDMRIVTADKYVQTVKQNFYELTGLEGYSYRDDNLKLLNSKYAFMIMPESFLRKHQATIMTAFISARTQRGMSTDIPELIVQQPYFDPNSIDKQFADWGGRFKKKPIIQNVITLRQYHLLPYYILHKDFNPNYRGLDGSNVLMDLLHMPKLVQLILENTKIDLTQKDDSGLTALDMAKNAGYKEVVSMIENKIKESDRR